MFIVEILKMIKEMVKVQLNIIIIIDIMEFGKMIKLKEKEYINLIMVK